jgi:hypothetical protein
MAHPIPALQARPRLPILQLHSIFGKLIAPKMKQDISTSPSVVMITSAGVDG